MAARKASFSGILSGQLLLCCGAGQFSNEAAGARICSAAARIYFGIFLPPGRTLTRLWMPRSSREPLPRTWVTSMTAHPCDRSTGMIRRAQRQRTSGPCWVPCLNHTSCHGWVSDKVNFVRNDGPGTSNPACGGRRRLGWRTQAPWLWKLSSSSACLIAGQCSGRLVSCFQCNSIARQAETHEYRVLVLLRPHGTLSLGPLKRGPRNPGRTGV